MASIASMREVGFFQPRLRWQWVLAAVLVAALQAPAQDNPASAAPGSAPSAGSIADAARQAKAPKAHAKKVFSDDDIDTTAGPLPRLKTEGVENGDEVLAAIEKYRVTHTAEETEQTVRTWYERYDQMFDAAIRQNQNVKAVGDANLRNGYDLCQASQDYEQCQNRRMAELRGAQNDQVVTTKNNELANRVQQAFMKVRNGLVQHGLHYDWFKVRNLQGNQI
jgi:hypothetical protein